MGLTIIEGGMRTRYHFVDRDQNGNLLLKMTHDIPPTDTYIQEDYTPSFSEAKSVLIPSWTPHQHKKYTWRMEKISDNASLYPKEVRERKINRILLTMFGYSEISKPTITTILRKTKNAEQDSYDKMSDIMSWDYGEYEPRRNHFSEEDYLNHPDREKYLSMLRNSRKKKSLKAKPKRKVVKKVKKCRCK